MTIVRFRGGLGNQMFTTAFCAKLGEYRDDIKVDTTEYSRARIHDGYEIEKIFDISFEKAALKQIRSASPYRPIGLGGRVGAALESRIQHRAMVKGADGYEGYLTEDFFNAISEDEQRQILSDTSRDFYLDGGWGRTRYWSCDRLGEAFTFKAELTQAYAHEITELSNANSCSIHIRRGDFVGSKYDICDTAYYREAIKRIKAVCKEAVFYVFTDDKESARRILEPCMAENEMHFPESKGITGAGDDLLLMTACRYHIDSTSTYAFWGSVLGHIPGTKVVAPDIWQDSLPQVIAEDDIIWMKTDIH